MNILCFIYPQISDVIVHFKNIIFDIKLIDRKKSREDPMLKISLMLSLLLSECKSCQQQVTVAQWASERN